METGKLCMQMIVCSASASASASKARKTSQLSVQAGHLPNSVDFSNLNFPFHPHLISTTALYCPPLSSAPHLPSQLHIVEMGLCANWL